MKQELIIEQAVIETPRFTLRPLRQSDVGLLSFFAADKRVAEMTTSIPHPLPPGASEAFVAKAQRVDRRNHVWAMDSTEQGGSELMGVISLAQMDRNQAEVSYWVAPNMWGTGLASEALKALVNANPLGNDTMFASVFQDNPGSARVLTNAKFAYLGDAEAFSVARGATVPTWTYSRKLDG